MVSGGLYGNPQRCSEARRRHGHDRVAHAQRALQHQPRHARTDRKRDGRAGLPPQRGRALSGEKEHQRHRSDCALGEKLFLCQRYRARRGVCQRQRLQAAFVRIQSGFEEGKRILQYAAGQQGHGHHPRQPYAEYRRLHPYGCAAHRHRAFACAACALRTDG